jgi:hypothetical protein
MAVRALILGMTLIAISLIYMSGNCLAEDALLKQVSSTEGGSFSTPIKRNGAGSFSVAVTLCYLGRCPMEGDVCCHTVVSGFNNWFCCRRGQRCGYPGGCLK